MVEIHHRRPGRVPLLLGSRTRRPPRSRPPPRRISISASTIIDYQSDHVLRPARDLLLVLRPRPDALCPEERGPRVRRADPRRHRQAHSQALRHHGPRRPGHRTAAAEPVPAASSRTRSWAARIRRPSPARSLPRRLGGQGRARPLLPRGHRRRRGLVHRGRRQRDRRVSRSRRRDLRDRQDRRQPASRKATAGTSRPRPISARSRSSASTRTTTTSPIATTSRPTPADPTRPTSTTTSRARGCWCRPTSSPSGTLLHASYASFNTHKTATSPGGDQRRRSDRVVRRDRADHRAGLFRGQLLRSRLDRPGDRREAHPGRSSTSPSAEPARSSSGSTNGSKSPSTSAWTPPELPRLLALALGHRLAALLLGGPQRFRPGRFLGRRDPVPPETEPHRHRLRRR